MRSAAAGAAVLLLAAAPPPQPNVAAIEARLFYSDTGRLSDNKLDAKGSFTGWNTVIGEGDSGGAADDVLIVAKIGLPKPVTEDVMVEAPLVITARAKGKVLARRDFGKILVAHRGTTSHALFLPGVGCAGRVDVTVQLGQRARTARLNMDCGE